ncbi:hypothetical protein [Streptomyces europaeiscabiei]|uniref:hypothetical protein n=1 Tax=Streptomyces europaeiscabiei TaxID=146819 RepID=UPI002E2B457E|nr:hypothetical protein [Streptomyces europaeiscabiei]
MNDRTHRQLLGAAARELLETLDPCELARLEGRLSSAYDLAEQITTCAAAVARALAGRDGSLPADPADLRALVASTLTFGSKGSGVYRNVQYAIKAYEELRRPAHHLPSALLVRARRHGGALHRLVHVIAVREAMLDGRPRALRDQPEITALAAAAVIALPGDPDGAARTATRALDAAVELQASYEAAIGAGGSGDSSHIVGTRTGLLGDPSSLVLPAAAREVCLEALTAAHTGPPTMGPAARDEMARRVKELLLLLDTCLTAVPGPMSQSADADWLAWYDACAARMADICAPSLPQAGRDIVDLVACLHPWTQLDRTARDRRQEYLVDFQTAATNLTGESLSGLVGNSWDGGAYEDFLDLDFLVQTTVSHLLAYPWPDGTSGGLVHDWLIARRPTDQFTGSDMWPLVLAVRSLVHRLEEGAAPLPRAAVPARGEALAAALHARAKEWDTGPGQVRQPYQALAMLLAPLWTRRSAALLSVGAHLRATGLTPKDAALVSAVLVCGPSQFVRAAAGEPTGNLPQNSPLRVRCDRPWTEPGFVENYTTLGTQLLTTPEAVRKRLGRYAGPGAELIRAAVLR